MVFDPYEVHPDGPGVCPHGVFDLASISSLVVACVITQLEQAGFYIVAPISDLSGHCLDCVAYKTGVDSSLFEVVLFAIDGDLEFATLVFFCLLNFTCTGVNGLQSVAGGSINKSPPGTL